MNSGKLQRIAIIGGGVSGLAAAHRLLEAMPHVDLAIFEASHRLGGVIQTTYQDGFMLEHSADSFLVSDELPWAGQLCQELGVELIPTSEQHRGALVVRGDKLHPVPDGLHLMSIRRLLPIFASPLLSLRGKLRVAYEPFIPRRVDGCEESLTQFATRRLGAEMFERIIQPLVAGIYTADPDRLSVAAALPQFVKMEQTYGSLARAAAANRTKLTDNDSGARYSLFKSPKDGMQALVDSLQRRISRATIHLTLPIKSMFQGHGEPTWTLIDHVDGKHVFDAVIVATSATAAGRLLANVSHLEKPLGDIEHVSTAIVCVGYRDDQVGHPLNGFGCVVPAIENRRILAVSFTNRKFAGRVPDGCVLFRVFVGGALQHDFAELPDDELMTVVRAELADLLQVRGDPLTTKIVRWPKTTPQYHLGHRQRVEEIESEIAQLPNLALAGNAYHGTGIPQCIRGGWQAAEAIAERRNG